MPPFTLTDGWLVIGFIFVGVAGLTLLYTRVYGPASRRPPVPAPTPDALAFSEELCSMCGCEKCQEWMRQQAVKYDDQYWARERTRHDREQKEREDRWAQKEQGRQRQEQDWAAFFGRLVGIVCIFLGLGLLLALVRVALWGFGLLL
jgi:hypothetical protein